MVSVILVSDGKRGNFEGTTSGGISRDYHDDDVEKGRRFVKAATTMVVIRSGTNRRGCGGGCGGSHWSMVVYQVNCHRRGYW